MPGWLIESTRAAKLGRPGGGPRWPLVLVALRPGCPGRRRCSGRVPRALPRRRSPAGICLFGGTLRHWRFVRWMRQPRAGPGIAVLAGMLPRMGIPLGLGIMSLQIRGADCWSRAGLLYYLVLFYMVTLGLETADHAPRRRIRPTPPTRDIPGRAR